MKKEIIDHLGNEYPTRKDMCDHYGISESVYYQRVRCLGWSIEKALTTPVQKKQSSVSKKEKVAENAKRKRNISAEQKSGFKPQSNLCSAEYVRYLKMEHENLRATYQEFCGGKSKAVLDALLNEDVSIGEKEREISGNAFFFHAYDLYAAAEYDKLKHFANESVIREAQLLFEEPELMPDLMKEIYIRFNEEYKITEFIVR